LLKGFNRDKLLFSEDYHFISNSIIAVPQALTYQTLSLAMRVESYPDIDIGILVQREQVQERNDHREGPNNEAIAFIECQSDAKFAIKFCVKQMNDLEHLGFFIYVDGQPVSKFSTDHPIEVEVLGGIVLEEDIIMPKEFKFSNQQGKIYPFLKNLI
jgi:hypothetical protein